MSRWRVICRPFSWRVRARRVARLAGVALLAAASGITPSRAAAPETAGPVVELPKFEVVDTRLLPPPESWRYAEIPGFEILSNISERESRRFVRDFLLLQEVIDAIMPGLRRVRAPVPTALILTGRGRSFDVFLPVDRADDALGTNGIFLQNAERGAIVVDFALTELRLDSENTAQADPYRAFYLEYFRSLIRRQAARPPPWLEEGLVQLLASTEFTTKWISFAQVGDGFGGQKPGDFNRLLAQHGLLPFDALFASEPPREGRAYWSAQAYAFVHLCLYGLNQRYQKPFLQFASRLANEPASERLFQECFGQSYRQMGNELRSYVEFTAYKATQFRAKKGRELPEPPAVQLRAATDAEVGRLKGEALRLGGHGREAHDALIAPYIRGERDPRLLAALGLDESLAGHPERAMKFLEAAAAARVERPSAYAELARLRLDAATGAAKLDDAQRRAILDPLLVARRQPPPMAAVYVLMAEAWSRSATHPPPDEFRILLEGVSTFPRDAALLMQVTLVAAGHGYPAEALQLAERGAKNFTGVAAGGEFASLAAALRRDAAGPTPSP
jgi:hypothetical protein